jgi:Family of unknown function (DUF5996)
VGEDWWTRPRQIYEIGWSPYATTNTLAVSSRGLSTGRMHDDGQSFEIELDLHAHRLLVRASDRGKRTLALGPMSVADLHDRTFACLHDLGVAA